MKDKINLGCGFNKLDTHHNVDSTKLCNPDEIVDLEVLPWPWADNSFDEIYAKDILEHIGANPKEFIKIIQEMYRVSKPNAVWKVIVPHWRCDLAFDDPTHIRTITSSTFKLFDQEKNVEAYQNKRSDTLLGILCDIDVQITDTKFNIIEYWRNEVEQQNLTNKQLDLNLNTMNNIAESTDMTLVVHKPCRYSSWASKFIGEK